MNAMINWFVSCWVPQFLKYSSRNSKFPFQPNNKSCSKFTCVCPNMFLKIATCLETFFTPRTRIWFLASMCPKMGFPTIIWGERFITSFYWTFKWAITCMITYMYLKYMVRFYLWFKKVQIFFFIQINTILRYYFYSFVSPYNCAYFKMVQRWIWSLTSRFNAIKAFIFLFDNNFLWFFFLRDAWKKEKHCYSLIIVHMIS